MRAQALADLRGNLGAGRLEPVQPVANALDNGNQDPGRVTRRVAQDRNKSPTGLVQLQGGSGLQQPKGGAREGDKREDTKQCRRLRSRCVDRPSQAVAGGKLKGVAELSAPTRQEGGDNPAGG